jgi:hypothetical protein
VPSLRSTAGRSPESFSHSTNDTSTLRPMSFGFSPFGRIKDPVYEPLWVGRRVIIETAPDRVEIRAANGEPLDGHDDLRVAVSESVLASELVLDGYAVPAPLQGARGSKPVTLEQESSVERMGRHLFLGDAGRKHREEKRVAAERMVHVNADEPTAFVAIDLLWLDGESLLEIPLLERKRLLESVLQDTELVRRTVVVRDPVELWFSQWRDFGFREYAIKSGNSRYEPGVTSRHWTTALIPNR